MPRHEVLSRLRQAAEIVPEADVFAVLRSLTEAYKEHQATEREIARIDANKEVALDHIRKKHDLYREAFCRIFDERRDIITRHFALIDKGIASNDRDLMLQGLQGLGEIVAASPFANFRELAQILEGERPLEF